MDYPKSTPNVGLVGGKFVDENTSTGQAGSLIPATWGNSVTDELLAVIIAAGLTPSESDLTQLQKAIQTLAASDVKRTVRVATTGAIALSGVQTIDGVALVAGNRVLVKDQAAGSQNGIYTVAAGAWVRALDANESAEYVPGHLVIVESGTAHGGAVWQLSNTTLPTLGTTALVYTRVFGKTGVVAGTYRSVTIDAQGRVTAGSNPTTLDGYGITDACVTGAAGVDYNALDKSGMYRFGSGSTPNRPAGWGASLALNMAFYDHSLTLGGAIGKDELAFRRNAPTGYGPWCFLWHSGNFDPATKADRASPAFTGTPTVPTAAAGTNNLQAANTAFVQAAIAALVGSSPAALDTLNELAAAIGNDPNFATTMLNALAGKANKATTLAGYGITDGVKFGDYGLGVPLALPGGSDLNTFVQPGVYMFGSGAPLVNAPITGASYLIVRGSALYPHQELRRIYQNRVFVRAAKVANPTAAASDWLDWDELLTSGSHVQATMAEAQEGVSTSTWMSPLRVYQAIRAAAFRCTEAAWGVIRLATQDETDAGALDIAAVTPLKLKKHSSIGVGQTWQNFLGSRAANTTYTNTTGRPIMVSVGVRDAGAYMTEIYVNGVLIGSWDQPTSIRYVQTFIVPAGATYMVSGNAGAAGGNGIELWTELR